MRRTKQQYTKSHELDSLLLEDTTAIDKLLAELSQDSRLDSLLAAINNSAEIDSLLAELRGLPT